MRLLEAIVQANRRALAGDAGAGLRPAEFENALPLIALTCVDPRLNPLLPEVLGVPEESFIWLRNAGNIITGPISSTMRSLALACAVKGGREIAIIGHTDCRVGATSMLALTGQLAALGVDRSRLPENLVEFFGLFGSERQNVLKAVEFTRQSPLIGVNIPVHGLLLDVATGGLEWLVNGYQSLGGPVAAAAPSLSSASDALQALKEFVPFQLGEMKFPEGRIGEVVARVDELAGRVEKAAGKVGQVAAKLRTAVRPPPPPPPKRPG